MGNPGAQRDVDKKIQIVVTGACIEALANTLKPGQQIGDATQVETAGQKGIDQISEQFMNIKVSAYDFGQDKKGFYRDIQGKKVYMDKKLVKKLKKDRIKAGKTINIKTGPELTGDKQEDIGR